MDCLGQQSNEQRWSSSQLLLTLAVFLLSLQAGGVSGGRGEREAPGATGGKGEREVAAVSVGEAPT